MKSSRTPAADRESSVLIVGGSSALGQELLRRLSGEIEFEVVATYHQSRFEGGIHFALNQDPNLASLSFVDSSYTVVLLSAISDPTTVYRDRENAWSVNCEGTKRLIDFVNDRGARLIFSSSVEVFDGNGAPFHEGSSPQPLNEYGRMKHLIEQHINAVFAPGKATVVRTPWITHLNPQSRCVIKNSYDAMLRPEKTTFASDYLTGIVAGSDVSEAYVRLLKMDTLPPFLHIASDGHFSRVELAELIANHSRRRDEMEFQIGTFHQLELVEARAKDTRLSNSYSKSLLDMTYMSWQDLVGLKTQLLDNFSKK